MSLICMATKMAKKIEIPYGEPRIPGDPPRRKCLNWLNCGKTHRHPGSQARGRAAGATQQQRRHYPGYSCIVRGLYRPRILNALTI